MKPVKLDLSKLKHVRTDKHVTVLQHPDGHEITIMHAALSKEAQAQLGALKGIAKDAQTPEQADQSKHLAADPQSRPDTGSGAITAIPGAAPKNGKVTVKMADGGGVTYHHEDSLPKGTKVPTEHQRAVEADEEAGENHRLNMAESIHYAVKDKKVIGHVGQDDEGSVKGVYVDPEHRRKGVAEGLYKHVASQSGGIKSDVPYAMEPSSKKLWEKLKTEHPSKVTSSKKGYAMKLADGGEVDAPQRSTPNPDDKTEKCVTRPSTGFGAVTVCDAEGGEVDAPQRSTSSPDASSSSKCYVSKANTGFGAIIRCDATGGQIHVADPKHVKFCAGCGGPVKFAKGGVAADESGSYRENADSSPDAAADSSGLDDKEEAYNDSIQTKHARRSLGSDTPFAQPITTHGETPVNLDENAMQHAVAQSAWNRADKDAAQTASDAKDANVARLSNEMGFKPKASDSAQPDVSGANQEADAGTVPTDTTKPPTPAPGAGNADPQTEYNEGMAAKNQANTNMAAAAQTKSDADVLTLAADHTMQQTINDKYQSSFKELDDERQHLQADVQNGHVDPNKFWDGDKTTGDAGHSRIMSAIGMIVAGFNPTNRPNAAIEYLNAEMDRNLKAQSQNLTSKENLLSANLRQFGNLKDATDMARIQQRDMVANQLAAAAAVAQGPQAKAAALAASGQMQQDASAKTHEFAMQRMMRGLMSDAGGDSSKIESTIRGMNMMGMPQGKTMSDAYVPGYGTTKSLSPVPQAVRDRLTTGSVLMDSLQDLQHFADNNTNLVPGTASYKEGMAKAVVTAQKIREGVLGGVMKAADAPILDALLGQNNPAGIFKSLTTDPKIKAIFKASSMEQDRVATSVGLPPRQTTLQRTDSSSQHAIVGPDGKKYIRGPDGKAVLVK